MASSPAPTVAGAAERVASTLTCGRSGSMASLGGPGSCRESCAELATTLATNPTCHGMCVDGVLYDMCQVLDLSTGSQRGPGGEQASSSSTSGSSNMYVKYDGGTLSDVLGGHPLASVSIPASGCPPSVIPCCSVVGGLSLASVSIPASGCPPPIIPCGSVPLPSLLKTQPLPFPEHCAPLKLGSELSGVYKGEEIGLSLAEVSPVKYLASEVDPSCSSGILFPSVEPVAPCKMGIHSLVEPVAPCKMGIHSLVEPVALCKMGIDSLVEPVAPCALGMDPSVCCFEKGHFWKGPCVVGGGDWSPDFETQSGKEERLDRPAKVSRSESSMPRRVLIVFSGPFNRPDGLASELTKLGYEVVEVDKLEGGEAHDIRRPAAFRAMLDGVQAGRYCAVFLGIPCSTYSVARIRQVSDGGPPQVRAIGASLGIPGLEDGWAREVRAANDVTEKSMIIATAAALTGAQVIIENPVGRSMSYPAAEKRFSSHVALWDIPIVQRWRERFGAHSVDCAQCALGGDYQKLTTLLYTPGMHCALSSLAAAVCTHAGQKHGAVAHGVDEDGGYESSKAAAYPAAFNRALALAIHHPRTPCFSAPSAEEHRDLRSHVAGPVGMRAGLARPHAGPNEHVGPLRGVRLTPSANPRRMEPELESVLRLESFSVVNQPPTTKWAVPPPMPTGSPGPLTTEQLIPKDLLKELERFRVQVRACLEAASRGRWRWARDHRPKPLHATHEESLLPAGRGRAWKRSDSDGLWYPLEQSSWPHSPPDCELELAVIIDEAVSMGYPDMEIISHMANGYPGPKMSLETVLGPPHVGALKNPVAFKKCADKDREKGWVRWGSDLPQVWPMRADPMNVVMRHGKGRMTIDKTMELVEGIVAYNFLIDLESQPEIEYVTVGQLGRAAAILMTIGLTVKLWGFDLEAYFRKTGKQRSHWWMSGFVHADGYGYDPRIQFGQREAPVLCGRQSCFLVAAMRRELHRLDAAYPTRAPQATQWLAARLAKSLNGSKGDLSSLFFLLMFVDDVGGASLDDPLYDHIGRPVMVLEEGVLRHQCRAELHYLAAIGMCQKFGHSDAVDKGAPPCYSMVFLGITISLPGRSLTLSKEKEKEYSKLLLSIVNGEDGVLTSNGLFATFDSFNSLVHKLLHACTVIVLGRQHLFYCLRSLRSPIVLRAGRMVPVSQLVVIELRWWENALRIQSALGLPLASRSVFPDPSSEGILIPYSDASREIASPESSGWGAWAIFGGVVWYVEGRWLPWELESLSINVLELAAMQFGTFTFIPHAISLGIPVSHVMEFTDNTSAEHSAERGKPKSERMYSLISYRYAQLSQMRVHSSVERVASVDNDVADGLSRGGSKLVDALRIAAGTGMPCKRVAVPLAVRSLSHLRNLS